MSQNDVILVFFYYKKNYKTTSFLGYLSVQCDGIRQITTLNKSKTHRTKMNKSKVTRLYWISSKVRKPIYNWVILYS